MSNYRIVKKSANPKTIAMLSGGKDSIASVVLLKKNGIDVTAIHFVHEWSSEIPTSEAKRICNEYNIPLIIKNYTREFCAAVNGYTAGRPCLICKKQMYKVLLKYLDTGEFGWLCIGDNSNDRTTIARIKKYIGDGHSEDDLMCSGYFGSEMGINLPVGMKVIRPLINMTVKDVEDFLAKENIVIKRINSTGDKYFEYHREGCAIQFADIGVDMNEKLYDELKLYNDCITAFARENNILASIHMPSKFIITIPRGYENAAEEYLLEHGLNVDSDVNSSCIPKSKTIIVSIFEVNTKIFTTKAYIKMFERFLERLELFGSDKSIEKYKDIVVCSYKDKETSVMWALDIYNGTAEIKFCVKETLEIKEIKFFDNLILELFRTRKYKVTVI